MKAFITGIGGQDGSYLAELLISKGYEVFGLTKKDTDLWRLKDIKKQIHLYCFNNLDRQGLQNIINEVKPDEIYHLASNVDARVDLSSEEEIFKSGFEMGYYILRSAIELKIKPKIYMAGSSLMFGRSKDKVQTEQTVMEPNTPYGISKVALYNFLKMYREVYGIYACMGFLYNHESIRRDEFFLPRKITMSAARIKFGRQKILMLGDINVKRDWSSAEDVVISMWMMLQKQKPEDYIVASGELHSIKDILQIVFDELNLDWKDYVQTDKSLIRKIEYTAPKPNPERIFSELGWKPKILFNELILEMLRNDLELLRNS